MLSDFEEDRNQLRALLEKSNAEIEKLQEIKDQHQNSNSETEKTRLKEEYRVLEAQTKATQDSIKEVMSKIRGVPKLKVIN